MKWMNKLGRWLSLVDDSGEPAQGAENNVYFMDFPSVHEKKLLTDQNARVLLRDFSDRQCRDFAQESTSMMILIYCLFSASRNPVERDIARALLDSYKTVSLKFGVPITVTNLGNEK